MSGEIVRIRIDGREKTASFFSSRFSRRLDKREAASKDYRLAETRAFFLRQIFAPSPLPIWDSRTCGATIEIANAFPVAFPAPPPQIASIEFILAEVYAGCTPLARLSKRGRGSSQSRSRVERRSRRVVFLALRTNSYARSRRAYNARSIIIYKFTYRDL